MAGRGEREPDAALVAFDRRPLNEPCIFEPCDELGHAGDGHPLERCQLPHADAGPVLDLDEQAYLGACHAEGVDLPP